MKFILKLNLLSMIYAVPFFLSTELLGNIYRLSRVTGLEIGMMDRMTTVYNVVGFICATMLFVYLAHHWMEGRKAQFWSVPLSIIYLAVFIVIVRTLLPITHPGDRPNPASGLIIIVLSILYPLYLVIINCSGILLSRSGQDLSRNYK